MKRSIFAVCLIIFAGIISGMTTPPPPPGANFKTFVVNPLFRCPNTDVRISYSTSPDTEVIITFGGQSVTAPGHGDYVIPADTINDLGDEVTVNVKINAQNGESRNPTIKTLLRATKIIRTGLRLTDNQYRFEIEMPDEAWDDNIYINRLELISPRFYTCTGSTTEHKINWQYDKGIYVSGYLTKDNGFAISLSPEVQAQGSWFYTFQNPSNDIYCDGWKLFYHSVAPQVQHTCFCKD